MLELTNVGLRAATMASRFVLLFFLARLLPPADVGRYGLVVVTVAYSVMLVGLDFYTFSTRELLGVDRGSWIYMLRDQAVLHVLVYVVVLPLGLLLFVLGVLPWALAGWFYVLLISEHVGKELYRLLIVAGRPVLATIVLFLQRGLWALVLPLLMLVFEALRTLDAVFVAWAVSSIAAIGLSLWGLGGLDWRAARREVDWGWIRKGLGVAAIFLLGTLFQRAIFTLDRYILESAGGLDLVGVYTFFMGIAMAAMAFLDAGVFAFLYPRLVSAFQSGKITEFRTGMRALTIRTVLATIALVAGAAVLVFPVLSLLDRPLYTSNISVFWLLLGAVTLYALGMIPHFGLYAMGRDRVILLARGTGLLVFLVTAVSLAGSAPLTGVGIGVVAGCGTLALVNLAAFLSLRPVRSG